MSEDEPKFLQCDPWRIMTLSGVEVRPKPGSSPQHCSYDEGLVRCITRELVARGRRRGVMRSQNPRDWFIDELSRLRRDDPTRYKAFESERSRGGRDATERVVNGELGRIARAEKRYALMSEAPPDWAVVSAQADELLSVCNPFSCEEFTRIFPIVFKDRRFSSLRAAMRSGPRAGEMLRAAFRRRCGEPAPRLATAPRPVKHIEPATTRRHETENGMREKPDATADALRVLHRAAELGRTDGTLHLNEALDEVPHATRELVLLSGSVDATQLDPREELLLRATQLQAAQRARGAKADSDHIAMGRVLAGDERLASEVRSFCTAGVSDSPRVERLLGERARGRDREELRVLRESSQRAQDPAERVERRILAQDVVVRMGMNPGKVVTGSRREKILASARNGGGMPSDCRLEDGWRKPVSASEIID